MSFKTVSERRAALQEQADFVASFNAHWAGVDAERRERERLGKQAALGAVYEAHANNVLRGAIQARAQFAAQSIEPGTALPSEIVWLPIGRHSIHATDLFGNPVQAEVLCDEEGATATIRSFDERLRAGDPVWIDRNHDSGEAVAWIRGFSWSSYRGILAHTEWTRLGEQCLRDQTLISFSPTFLHDRETNRVAGIMRKGSAGGLVNAPAFGAAMPLIMASARSAIADSFRENLLSAGYATADVDCVTAAIEAGRSPAAIALLVEHFSGQRPALRSA